MKVEVVFLPPIATELSSKLCIVIDVLRATSALVSMFRAGARRVILAEDVPGALALARTMPQRPLVCGEAGGLPPAGFDLGNSPREFDRAVVEGKDLVMCTSNGTRAMWAVASAPVVLAGSLLNGRAVVRTALREAEEKGLDIALICSGDILGTKFAIDDAFCAGHLLTLIEAEVPGVLTVEGEVRQRLQRPETVGHSGTSPALALEESATAALRLYGSYTGVARASASDLHPPREAILKAFWESHNAQVLKQVGLSEDVFYCAQLDISDCVPRLRVEGDRLMLSVGC